jgi:WD40 repeat protein
LLLIVIAPIIALSINPGHLLAADLSPKCAPDDKVRNVLDTAGATEINMRLSKAADSQAIRTLAFSADSRQLAVPGDDGRVRLVDVRSGEITRYLDANIGAIYAVAWSSDGKFIAASGEQGRIKVWDAISGVALASFSNSNKQAIIAVAISISDLYIDIATIDTDGDIELWNLDGQLLEVRRSSKRSVAAIAAMLDIPRDFLFASAIGNNIFISTESNERHVSDSLVGHTGDVTSIAVSADRRYVLTGSVDRTAIVWDVTTGAQITSLKGHTACVTGVAFSPDGEVVATSSMDDTAVLWDAQTGKAMRTFARRGLLMTSVAISPDGKHIAVGSDSGSVTLWTVQP